MCALPLSIYPRSKIAQNMSLNILPAKVLIYNINLIYENALQWSFISICVDVPVITHSIISESFFVARVNQRLKQEVTYWGSATEEKKSQIHRESSSIHAELMHSWMPFPQWWKIGGRSVDTFSIFGLMTAAGQDFKFLNALWNIYHSFFITWVPT